MMKRMLSLAPCCVLALSLCGCGQNGGSSAAAWQEQYDLGVKYLENGSYNEAVLAFTAAIDIDPKQPDAYLKLVEAYIGLDDPDSARKALEDGLAATGDERLQEKLDGLNMPKEADGMLVLTR